jgi:hypothetical protein
MVTEYIVDEEAEQLKVAGVCRRADGVWATPVVVRQPENTVLVPEQPASE